MKKQITLLVLAALFITQSSFAWGKKGHALVAEIAFTYLDPSVQTIVTKYLNGRSIQDAANWMDELRDDHSYDYLKPYHYVNFDKGVKVVNHEGDNIIFRLTQTIQELKNYKNLSDEDVKMKICIIFHLVGDLHQPLHVGFGTDKGGNTQQINYNGKGTNLHSFFDSGIINARNMAKRLLGAQYLFQTPNQTLGQNQYRKMGQRISKLLAYHLRLQKQCHSRKLCRHPSPNHQKTITQCRT